MARATKIIEGKARSLGDLLSETTRIRRAFKPDFHAREEIWFRGQGKRESPLQPLLYRQAEAPYHYDEATLLDRFVSLATPLCASRPTSDWEWYFLARHHGLPSRLLDWTESLLNAAYFALLAHMPNDRLALDKLLEARPSPPCFEDGCPAVWILDAGSLNKASIGLDRIVVPPGPKSDAYLPRALRKRTPRNRLPIAVLPPRANLRIAAQQGMFTVHGRDERGLDELSASHPEIRLGVVRLDLSNIGQLISELQVAGVHRLSLFPDLDSVVVNVTWFYQSKM